ncbi:MAG: hypothetical protein ACI9ON_001403 [Limisphaerales bacterium]|jgi:hypothetical protein
MSPAPIQTADLDKLQLISVAANRITDLETFCWALLDWVNDLTQVEDCVVYVKPFTMAELQTALEQLISLD